jgi:hypothetical protein
MVRVLPIAVLAGCSSAAVAPVAPSAPSAPAASDSLWDHGTFVVVDGEQTLSDSEERFEIYATPAGFRFAITWKRETASEPTDGTITLETDHRFGPITGDDVMTVHGATGTEITRSSLRRDPDGRLATEVVAASGAKDVVTSQRANDWFIGGKVTAFLTVLCQASSDLIAPVVYPDKDTTLEPPQPLPIAGSARAVTIRVLTYAASRRRIVAACEQGKLAGEVASGVTIVRTGDLDLARALARLPGVQNR